jgi:predicted DNA-binding protein with PD1-like motif
MTFVFDGYNYTVRLSRGEKLSDAMKQFFAETDIEGASITAVGGAEQLELGFYDLDAQDYLWKSFPDLYEITGLIGTIALGEDGKPMYHLHGTFGARDYSVVGGHVKDFVVGGTCELFIHRTYKPLHRKRDDETGLNLLDLHD